MLRLPAGGTVQAIAIAAIIILTGANLLGARVGAAVSEVTTLVKVTALAAIILGAFLLGNGSLSNITEGGVVQGGGLARAVAAVIAEGKDVTYDMKPDRNDPSAVGTAEMGDAIIRKLGAGG